MKKLNLSLYHKFALVIIFGCLLPMSLLSTIIINHMFKEYGKSLHTNYEQAAIYANASVDNVLKACNDVSKMPYYYNFYSGGDFQYNYMSFDNLRKIVYGVGVEDDKKEKVRNENMKLFLRNVQNVDSLIKGVHFIAKDLNGDVFYFHYSKNNAFFKDEIKFEQSVRFNEIDKETKQMILIPPHKNDYFNMASDMVFTVARNYFDLTGNVGQTPYVGTLFIDFDLKKIEEVFETLNFEKDYTLYLSNEKEDCFYSNHKEFIGQNLIKKEIEFEETQDKITIKTNPNQYGLKIQVIIETAEAYKEIKKMQNIMYMFIEFGVVFLLIGALIFSSRLTKPIRNIMKQMSHIETGNFLVKLPVQSNDEIGVLSQRFNEMSEELDKYISQFYIARIKQKEAEMTALKAQIYPHFLYNTLEIIRMTALEDETREKVPDMIEALSQQIRYIVGTAKDIVPLCVEADIVKKYIYLLNCRIAGKVQLEIHLGEFANASVPKLILQPIVENSYIHGIKPKDGIGNILIEAIETNGILEISIMDNGIGMNGETLNKLKEFLESDEIGIKNEYNWQSIGLKNVHDRIKYLYGRQYGIKITSTPSIGTMVRIIMPCNIGKEGFLNAKNDIS